MIANIKIKLFEPTNIENFLIDWHFYFFPVIF
jgi:hypothetical protein